MELHVECEQTAESKAANNVQYSFVHVFTLLFKLSEEGKGSNLFESADYQNKDKTLTLNM